MSRLYGPDGRAWRVGRRCLPRRPRPYRPLRRLWNAFLALQDPISAVLGVLALVALLPLAVVFLLDWTVCLLLTPFAELGRYALGRPWTVVAYTDAGPEYHGEAPDAAAADDLACRARADVSQHGQPTSLGNAGCRTVTATASRVRSGRPPGGRWPR